jgi:hypothetical protein
MLIVALAYSLNAPFYTLLYVAAQQVLYKWMDGWGMAHISFI